MHIRPIKTEKDYEKALETVEQLWGAKEGDGIAFLGDQFAPVGTLWVVDVDGDETAVWRIQISFKIKDGLIIAQKQIFSVHIVQQMDKIVARF